LYFYISKILAPFLNITNLLVLVILFSYFFKNFFFKKILKTLNLLAIILIIILGFFPIGKNLIYTLEKDYIKNKIPIKYDYIVVLAGSEDVHTSSIINKINLNSGSERLIASVKLANKNRNSKIIFLGGNGFLKKNDLNEADVAKNFYIDVGFDLTRVVFIENTRNTVENLKELKKLNLENDNKIIIVTSAFHMKRTQLIAQKLNLDLNPYAVDFRAIDDLKAVGLINYYQSFNFVENLRHINLYFREFFGTIVLNFLF
jgi:uncharacterized SAM-binding protein YcdF (DUF218 family)